MPSSRTNDDTLRAERQRPMSAAPDRREHAPGQDQAAPAVDVPAPAAPSELEALRADLAAARDELARTDDRYKRALADLDNYRKRVERDTQRRLAEERERLLGDWLEALDSVERALRLQPEDPGLRAVLEQMEAILTRQGARRLGAAGEPFDPMWHEAVAVRASAGVPDRTILEVARSGFALGDDRVLRPAQVVVSQRREEQD